MTPSLIAGGEDGGIGLGASAPADRAGELRSEPLAASQPSGRSSHSAVEELADRCEAATGPDRELDAAIARHFLPDVESDDGDFWFGNFNKPMQRVPDYSASIDAALWLVPEGWAWMTGCAPSEAFFATLAPTDEGGLEADDEDVTAATPALALCAAALRARTTGQQP